MVNWRRAGRICGWVTVTGFSFLLLGNWWVIHRTTEDVFHNESELPSNPVGLVLGTSSRLPDGSPNPYFDSRMKSAASLFHKGKIHHIIVSGDNRTRFYNEPVEMQKALVALQVPDSCITLDYAGLRTLDSIIRSKEVFGQNRLTIITQPFHSYRAIFISQYYDIDAVALTTDEEAPAESVARVYLREYLARAKAILDLYVLKTGPRHLGAKEPIVL